MDESQWIEGWEFRLNDKFNEGALKVLKAVKTSGCAYFEADDSPDQQDTVTQLKAASGEHFDVICEEDYHIIGVVERNRFKIEI